MPQDTVPEKPASTRAPIPKKKDAPKKRFATVRPDAVHKITPARDRKGTYAILAISPHHHHVGYWDGRKRWVTERKDAMVYKLPSEAEIQLSRIPKKLYPEGAKRAQVVSVA